MPGDAERVGWVVRPGRWAAVSGPCGWCRFGIGGLCKGFAFDLDAVSDSTFVERGPERAAVAVAGVGGDQGWLQPLCGESVEHLDRQHPLRTVPLIVGDRGLAAPLPGRRRRGRGDRLDINISRHIR